MATKEYSNYEVTRAIMEASSNEAEDEYFKARQHLDTHSNRRLFHAGFERAWNIASNRFEEKS